MFNLKKDDVVVPYKEKELVEISDFELIKSFIHDMSNTSMIEQRMNQFQQRPPTNFDRSSFGSQVYEALSHKLGNTAQGAMESINIRPNLRKALEAYLEEDLTDYHFLDDYSSFINIDELPVVTEVNKEEKILQFQIELFNQIFKPFEKNLIGDTYYVKIPASFISNYEYFVDNKLFLQKFEQNEILFEMINSYFKNILYNKSHNFTLSKAFEHTGLGKQVKFNEDDHLLSIKIDKSKNSFMYNNNVLDQYHYQLWLFSSKMISLFTTIELIGFLIERSPVLSIEDEKELFLNVIKDRRVPISEITHKGAHKKADSLGLTHLFLPLDEEAIPAGLPFSLKVKLDSHEKITNIWTIVPPTKGLSVVRNYIGHNNHYSQYTTLAEPHLVGIELLKVKFNDDFYDYLIDGYDWEHKDEAIKTLELVKEYPRLSNDLKKLAKEYSIDD